MIDVKNMDVEMSEILARVIRKRRLQIHGNVYSSIYLSIYLSIYQAMS